MRYLDERKIGWNVGAAGVVPIVPAAILIDLGFGGDPKIRPTADCGYRAATAAAAGPVAEGNVGAGAGRHRRQDRPRRERAMKGGIGTASITLPNGLVVGAIAAVNAVGDIVDHVDRAAGGRAANGGRQGAGRRPRAAACRRAREGRRRRAPGGNTTIAVVATNARLTKAEVNRVAIMADDGFARAIRPSHTVGDGDTVFVLATGQGAAGEPDGRRRAGRGGAGRSHRARGGAGAGARRPARGPRSRARCPRASGELSPRRRRRSTPLPSSAWACGRRASCARSSEFFVAGRSLGAGAGVLVDAGGQHRRRARCSAPAGSPIGTASARGGGWDRRASARWCSPSPSRRGCGRWPRSTTSTPPATTSSSATAPTVRGVATALVGIGSLALLAGQLIAGATILNVLTGMPRWAGALTGGAIMTIYFTSGGLLGSAWVNTRAARGDAGRPGAGACRRALLPVGGLGNAAGRRARRGSVDLDVLGRARLGLDAAGADRARRSSSRPG